ncbi:MAG: helix-turn-helix domain-containing protein [Candidatus Rokuibacteriota bacterium]
MTDDRARPRMTPLVDLGEASGTCRPIPLATEGGIGVAVWIAMANAGTYHAAVRDSKRHLIEGTLRRLGGNRAQAARVLGLQRTYLLRLIRQLSVATSGARRSGPERPPR